MSKFIRVTFALLIVIVSTAVNAVPTEFPILKPAGGDGDGGSTAAGGDEGVTVDLDTVVVEAATTPIDGIVTEENNENGKEFDPNDCFLPKERGPCRAAIDSWFFNVATKSCENFLYSGCRGNNNRFSSKSICELRCSQSQAGGSSTPSPKESSVASGSSAAVIETTTPSSPARNSSEEASSTVSTTFKPKLPDCPKFEGCSPKCVIIQDRSDRGCKKCLCGTSTSNDDESKQKQQQLPPSIQVSSGNNLTVTEPVGSVSGVPASVEKGDIPSDATASEDGDAGRVVSKPQDVCQLPAKRGHCRAMQTRYRYDSQVKDCVEFHYGGCDANPNNFVSKEKCVEYCKGQ